MPTNGKLVVGERLTDWQCPRGYVTVVESIVTGALATPIDIRSPRWSSSAETCAMYGGRSHWQTPSTINPKGES